MCRHANILGSQTMKTTNTKLSCFGSLHLRHRNHRVQSLQASGLGISAEWRLVSSNRALYSRNYFSSYFLPRRTNSASDLLRTCSMAKRSHVPKFGNWEKDNTPYTAYFERARKEKSGAKMNPNDPEENPQAFGYQRRGTEREPEYSFFNQTPIHPSHKKTYADISYNEGDYGEQNAHRRHLSDQPKSVRHRRSRLSEEPGGVNRRNSDRLKSPSKPKNIRIEPESKSVSGSNSFSSPGKSQSSNSSFARHRRRTRRNSPRADTDNHLRASSPVPKFGPWDETDPRSGEVFTELFNRVKEEKTCVIYPANTPQPTYHLNRRKPHRSSRRPKSCCCPIFG